MALKTVKIPLGVKTIENNAFLCCKSLESISLPDSVQTIQKNAFKDCTVLLGKIEV
jgi:hypothetical protein